MAIKTLEERRREIQRKEKHDIYLYWDVFKDERDIVQRLMARFGKKQARVYQLISEFIKHGEPKI
jgi:hypothetical protein